MTRYESNAKQSVSNNVDQQINYNYKIILDVKTIVKTHFYDICGKMRFMRNFGS